MPLRLIEKTVKEIEAPKSGAITIWDAELKGFGVRVFAPSKRRPMGARSFFMNYRVDGIERRFTIGPFPDWTAKAARAEAEDLRRRIDKGEDPTVQKRDRREAPTIRDLADRYYREHLPRKAASSQINDRQMIEGYVVPRLGEHRKVADIHHGDIKALHEAISARGTLIRANRVLAVTSKMFSLSLRPMEGDSEPWRNQAQGNPCAGVERNQEEGHERFFSEVELAALSDALVAYGPTPAGDCLRFIMLTGCRPGEAMIASWQHFDVEPGFWVKPSQHTKQRKIHRVPLGPAALELLEEIRERRRKEPRGQRADFVFPGQKTGTHLKQIRTAWEFVTDYASVGVWGSSKDDKIAKLIADLERAFSRRPTVQECRIESQRRNIKLPAGLTDSRAYDLRHSFASIGAAGGLSLQIIGKLLGHTQHRTTMRYAHLADDPLREAAARIAGVIAGAGKASATVIPFKSGDRS